MFNALYLKLAGFIAVCALFIIFANEISEIAKKLWARKLTQHILVMLGIAAVIVFMHPYIPQILGWLLDRFDSYVAGILSIIGFGQWDLYIARVFALTTVPLFLSAIPAGIYWLVRGKKILWYYQIFWCSFIVLCLSWIAKF